jgi:hypothetical protein
LQGQLSLCRPCKGCSETAPRSARRGSTQAGRAPRRAASSNTIVDHRVPTGVGAPGRQVAGRARTLRLPLPVQHEIPDRWRQDRHPATVSACADCCKLSGTGVRSLRAAGRRQARQWPRRCGDRCGHLLPRQEYAVRGPSCSSSLGAGGAATDSRVAPVREWLPRAPDFRLVLLGVAGAGEAR